MRWGQKKQTSVKFYHKWFAWHPVKLYKYGAGWVWLETIERMEVGIEYSNRTFYVYREIEQENNS